MPEAAALDAAGALNCRAGGAYACCGMFPLPGRLSTFADRRPKFSGTLTDIFRDSDRFLRPFNVGSFRRRMRSGESARSQRRHQCLDLRGAFPSDDAFRSIGLAADIDQTVCGCRNGRVCERQGMAAGIDRHWRKPLNAAP